MQPRMKNPLAVVPGAYQSLSDFGSSAKEVGVPLVTLYMTYLRASQINGCSLCTKMHSEELKEAGESEERIWLVAAWRESPLFNDAERAALALTEAVTRIADRSDPVPDEVWDEAAKHYDEKQLGALVVSIATINAYNRLNVATRQPPLKAG